jgi:aminoglycoside phosphotransferase (APT) family kinase protein
MNDEAQIHVVFPMAEPVRLSGFKYRPFIDIGDGTMIEAAVRPFRREKERIARFYFVALEEHEKLFGVTARIQKAFGDLPHEVVLLDKPTTGPADTVVRAVRKAQLTGRGIICDVDHSIEVEPLFRAVKENHADCILPTWSLRGEDLKRWSVAAVVDGRVRAVAEKRLPDGAGEFMGVIGCYYIRDVAMLGELSPPGGESYVSGIVHRMLARGQHVRAVPITRAEFFGESKKLAEVRAKHGVKVGTIFCDIDGVVSVHEDVPRYDKPLQLIEGSIERLQDWMDRGYHIVLTTARDETSRTELEAALKTAHVPYHRLIAGLPSGPRVLINDRKPSATLLPQAEAIEVKRNQGIRHIQLSPTAPSVLRRFKGGSFAETLLVEDAEKVFIRKRVSKAENLSLGYSKLKNQYRTMERFARLGGGIVPALFGECDNTFEYRYDMEYLPGHKLLSEHAPSDQERGLARVLDVVGEKVYSNRKAASRSAGEGWLLAHLQAKVYPKLDAIRSNPRLTMLAASESVEIDGRAYPGLKRLLEKATSSEHVHTLAPSFFSAVHGDLTFENVLFAGDDARVIDMDGAEDIDAPELDLGKLCQSLLARYEEWAHGDHALFERIGDGVLQIKRELSTPPDTTVDVCLDRWSSILDRGRDEVYVKGSFYAGLHLIRMVMFRLKVSEEQALFALANAVRWISSALRI